MDKVKCVFNRAFSLYNKLARSVMAKELLLRTLARIVVVRAEYERTKSYRLRSQRALMRAIKYDCLAKVKVPALVA